MFVVFGQCNLLGSANAAEVALSVEAKGRFLLEFKLTLVMVGTFLLVEVLMENAIFFLLLFVFLARRLTLQRLLRADCGSVLDLCRQHSRASSAFPFLLFLFVVNGFHPERELILLLYVRSVIFKAAFVTTKSGTSHILAITFLNDLLIIIVLAQNLLEVL